MTALLGAFLVLHGLLHPGVWTAPQQQPGGAPAPFTPGRSWLLASAGVPASSSRTAALTLAWYTAVSRWPGTRLSRTWSPVPVSWRARGGVLRRPLPSGAPG